MQRAGGGARSTEAGISLGIPALPFTPAEIAGNQLWRASLVGVSLVIDRPVVDPWGGYR